MATIGKQIIAARKAKGMTQDALAKALNVSRSAVSHWESDRRMPDAEMLLKLSTLLDYSFEDAAERAPDAWTSGIEAVPGEAGRGPDRVQGSDRANAPGTPCKASSRQVAGRRIARFAVVAVLVAASIAFAWLQDREKTPTVYTADDGTLYTIDQFRQQTPREDGRAWLLGEKGVKIITAGDSSVWMYDFTFHEMNSVGVKIDRVDVCTFYGDKVLPMIISGESLSLYELKDSIPPRRGVVLTAGLYCQKVTEWSVKLSKGDRA